MIAQQRGCSGNWYGKDGNVTVVTSFSKGQKKTIDFITVGTSARVPHFVAYDRYADCLARDYLRRDIIFPSKPAVAAGLQFYNAHSELPLLQRRALA